MKPNQPELNHLVAIVGVGGVFPGSPTLYDFWKNIESGKDLAVEVPQDRWIIPGDEIFNKGIATPDKLYSRKACLVDHFKFDATEYGLDPEFLEKLDPLFHLMLSAGKQAIEDAEIETESRRKTGVILGNIVLPTETISRLAREILEPAMAEKLLGREQSVQIETDPINRYVAGMPGGIVAQSLGLESGSYTLDAACASSLYAVKLAVDELLAARSDVMLTGGVSRPDCLYTQMGFSQLRALSPTGRCSPFDGKGDGLVVGEGAGMFVLMRLADAISQNKTIYAVIHGVGLSNDVQGNLLAPDSDGQMRAMDAAYMESGWNPADVDLIECHATGTPVGDSVEFESLSQLWARPDGSMDRLTRSCIIGSVKSNVGHLLTGAGAAGLMKTLFAMRHKVLPPTANFSSSGSKIDIEGSPFEVLTKSKPWEKRKNGAPRRAAVSAFGFGGINAHVLLEEWNPEIKPPVTNHKKTIQFRKRREPIAITGIALHMGPWDSVETFSQRIFKGQDEFDPLSEWRFGGFEKLKFQDGEQVFPFDFPGFSITNVDIPFQKVRIPPNELKAMLPQQLLMLKVAGEAISQTIWNPKHLDESMVCIGIGLDLNTTNFQFRWYLQELAKKWGPELGYHPGTPQFDQWVKALRDAYNPPLTADRTMGALGGIVASRIARAYRIGGPSFTVSCEGASGIRAMDVGVRNLRNGSVYQAVVGAVDLVGDFRSIMGIHSHYKLKDTGRLLCEGAVALTMKRMKDAVADKDTVHAVIRGVGFASGGPDNLQKVLLEAMKNTYHEIPFPPSRLGYIEQTGIFKDEVKNPEKSAVQEFYELNSIELKSKLGDTLPGVGYSGAVSGLASLIKVVLAMQAEIKPAPEPGGLPRYWLRNRTEGPRISAINSVSVDGNCCHVVVGSVQSTLQDSSRTLALETGIPTETLFFVSGDKPGDLQEQLELLMEMVEKDRSNGLFMLGRQWWLRCKENPVGTRNISLIARHMQQLKRSIEYALKGVRTGELFKPKKYVDFLSWAPYPDNIYFNPEPLGIGGKIVFVYPGSGNHYPGMGQELSALGRDVLRIHEKQNRNLKDQFVPELIWDINDRDTMSAFPKELILSQVAYGAFQTELLKMFNIIPKAAVGYSLGESTALVSLGFWINRDELFRRVSESPLFIEDLAGDYNAVRKAWKLGEGEEVDWVMGIVNQSAEEVSRLIESHERIYLLIVNTPHECVIGGSESEIKKVFTQGQFYPVKGVTASHCKVVEQVEEAYGELHLIDVETQDDVAMYSAAWAEPYDVTRQSAAMSITTHAVQGFDFTQVIQRLFDDGFRVFVELGPGASCTRMIRRILRRKPFATIPLSDHGKESCESLIRLLAKLWSQGIPVSLEPLYESKAFAKLQDKKPDDSVLNISWKQQDFTFSNNDIAKSEMIPEPPEPEPTDVESVPDKIGEIEKIELEPQPEVTPVEPEPAEDPRTEEEDGDTESAKVVEIEPELEEPEIPDPPKARGNKEDVDPPEVRLEMEETLLENQEEGIREETNEVGEEVKTGFIQSSKIILEAMQAADQQTMQAHAKFLEFSRKVERNLSDAIGIQMAVIKQAAKISGESSGGEVSRRKKPETSRDLFMDREKCLQFAVGKVSDVLGSEYEELDNYPTRVRLPDEPLMLVDRILEVRGKALSMTPGQVITEHDVLHGDWYIENDRAPTCIAVESGQADLFLSGFLGIDFQTQGLAMYRLLDAVVTFHRGLPRVGEVVKYHIYIDEFFRQGETHLFRFHFDATVNGELILTMREGCAGFFTEESLAMGQGIVKTSLDKKQVPGVLPDDWTELVSMGEESYSDEQLQALRSGDLAGCFGDAFKIQGLKTAPRLPGGNMKLIDRITSLDPKGGRYGLGMICGEADIKADDWFLVCHFVDDQVMPGTLMYECCLHTLRVYLMRMGWVAESDEMIWEPVPGVQGRLKCRGQVIASTKHAVYEVSIKEIGYNPAPYAIADALMYADGKPIVEMIGLSLQLTDLSRDKVECVWKENTEQVKPLYGRDKILAFAVGKPSEAFGDQYTVFDSDRVIARLPGPPYQFLDRITRIDNSEKWQLVPRGTVWAEYDVPGSEWYFENNGISGMPYSVLLEIALQPCGWFAAYMGSALTSDDDLSFRNLGGSGTIHKTIFPGNSSLKTRVLCTKISSSGGMIIQHFDFEVTDNDGPVYSGSTYFGFFTKEALKDQVGIREVMLFDPDTTSTEGIVYPQEQGLPSDRLVMMDSIVHYEKKGGPSGLGFIQGVKTIDPEEWFFKAHFYQDPVWPGSLGLEAMIQLMEFDALQRWGDESKDLQFEINQGNPHEWLYRGQVIPVDKKVTVQALITEVEENNKILIANGFLSVDGRIIYQMTDFSLKAVIK